VEFWGILGHFFGPASWALGLAGPNLVALTTSDPWVGFMKFRWLDILEFAWLHAVAKCILLHNINLLN
jgi:hypothetical protein